MTHFRFSFPAFRAAAFPFLLIFFAGTAFFSCSSKSPRIDSIDPKIGRTGEIITITGENFGKGQDESYVTIAGISPTNSSYISWQDNQISLKAPELGDSGLVYVHVKNKKSNGALFANQAELPARVQGEDIGLEPRIVSIAPLSGAAGSLISITGNNFGSSRERSAVFFTWEGEGSPLAPAEAKTAEFVEVSETEFGYESWNEREIRVRVPDGAASGNVEVRTLRGNSRPFFFNISGNPGTKVFRDKRSYTINYTVNVRAGEGNGNNTLYLWMPQPAVSAAQRKRELLSRNTEPFVENYRGTSLFKLDNFMPGSEAHIELSYKIDVFAVETNMRPQAIRQEEKSAINAVYTQPDSLIPSNDPLIVEQANAIAGRERNPYLKAQRIYEWLISEGIIREAAETVEPETPEETDEPDEVEALEETEESNETSSIEQNEELPASPVEALTAKRADTYTAALLYCALARASGIPCIPVSGVLINRSTQTIRHYWVEFWIDGLGWIPADPGMGAGAVPQTFRFRQDGASFYFGNIDSQRIAFSRGQATLSQMDPRGRAIGRIRSYALQNIWEEVVGGLESYSSLWGDITVTGVYAQ